MADSAEASGNTPTWSVDALSHWLGTQPGIGDITIESIERLGGGAIQGELAAHGQPGGRLPSAGYCAPARHAR